MSQNAKVSADTNRSSALDTFWLIAAIAVLVGSVYAFYKFEVEINVLVRTVMVLAAIVISALMIYMTEKGRNAWGYVRGARIEMRKTTWPTKQETMQTAIMVSIVTLIVAIFLWLLDMGLLWAVKHLTGRA